MEIDLIFCHHQTIFENFPKLRLVEKAGFASQSLVLIFSEIYEARKWIISILYRQTSRMQMSKATFLSSHQLIFKNFSNLHVAYADLNLVILCLPKNTSEFTSNNKMVAYATFHRQTASF